ncbi:hypothetical protein PHLCEN_2v439 [Hermanssonia centrifuga]|uniref:Uncharacterized protein n=1 Tax=Hermanssonia centrifuga TaxID=98765 RepID=A0A2R6S662_9APHY|nr:hypothetical protein PHLCEN_2v439 [Hermanssonia centrifuga]
MVDYIVSVSSLGGDSTEPLIPQGMDTHERIRMINTLNQRVSKLPALTKEAMPLLPHMLDIPKHLAVMTSVVVRHTRKPLPAKTGAMAEHDFDEFCSICLQVEEQALFRVSQLARRRKHQPPASISFLHTPSSLPMVIPSRDRKSSLPSSSPSEQKHRRPPTAPYNPGIPDTADITMSPNATAGITCILSRTSLSDARQSSAQSSSMGGHVTAGSAGEPQSLPIPRPAFTHHPRSSSTDSALVRIDQKTSGSPSTPLAYVSPDANDDSIEGIRSRKSLFRGILRR